MVTKEEKKAIQKMTQKEAEKEANLLHKTIQGKEKNLKQLQEQMDALSRYSGEEISMGNRVGNPLSMVLWFLMILAWGVVYAALLMNQQGRTGVIPEWLLQFVAQNDRIYVISCGTVAAFVLIFTGITSRVYGVLSGEKARYGKKEKEYELLQQEIEEMKERLCEYRRRSSFRDCPVAEPIKPNGPRPNITINVEYSQANSSWENTRNDEEDMEQQKYEIEEEETREENLQYEGMIDDDDYNIFYVDSDYGYADGE